MHDGYLVLPSGHLALANGNLLCVACETPAYARTVVLRIAITHLKLQSNSHTTEQRMVAILAGFIYIYTNVGGAT